MPLRPSSPPSLVRQRGRHSLLTKSLRRSALRYWCFKAITGSTRVARSAGIRQPSAADKTNTPDAAPNAMKEFFVAVTTDMQAPGITRGVIYRYRAKRAHAMKPGTGCAAVSAARDTPARDRLKLHRDGFQGEIIRPGAENTDRKHYDHHASGYEGEDPRYAEAVEKKGNGEGTEDH